VKRSRSARSRKCRSRSATRSIPTTSSTPTAPTSRVGSCCPIHRPIVTSTGPRRAFRARGVLPNGSGAWSAKRRTEFSAPATVLRKAAHRALARVSDDIEKLHFNVCVAHIYEFANSLNTIIGDIGAQSGARKGEQSGGQSGGKDASEMPSVATPDLRWAMREAVNILVRLFHPMMPHLAEECWAMLGHDTLVAQAPWPEVERALLVEETLTLPVQINGRKRADVTVARDAGEADIENAVLALEAVQRALEGKRPKKVIIVPQRIVNVVA